MIKLLVLDSLQSADVAGMRAGVLGHDHWAFNHLVVRNPKEAFQLGLSFRQILLLLSELFFTTFNNVHVNFVFFKHSVGVSNSYQHCGSVNDDTRLLLNMGELTQLHLVEDGHENAQVAWSNRLQLHLHACNYCCLEYGVEKFTRAEEVLHVVTEFSDLRHLQTFNSFLGDLSAQALKNVVHHALIFGAFL